MEFWDNHRRRLENCPLVFDSHWVNLWMMSFYHWWRWKLMIHSLFQIFSRNLWLRGFLLFNLLFLVLLTINTLFLFYFFLYSVTPSFILTLSFAFVLNIEITVIDLILLHLLYIFTANEPFINIIRFLIGNIFILLLLYLNVTSTKQIVLGA